MAHAHEQSYSRESGGARLLRKQKILVVDDSEICREVARSALEAGGFVVTALESPIGLSLAVQRERPALVLIDVMMPALSGDKAVAVLRGRRLHKCAMVLYSDRPSAELNELAVAAGAAGYICKSADVGALVQSVRRFLSP
jgi:two-component system OmpR family response regulator